MAQFYIAFAHKILTDDARCNFREQLHLWVFSTRLCQSLRDLNSSAGDIFHREVPAGALRRFEDICIEYTHNIGVADA